MKIPIIQWWSDKIILNYCAFVTTTFVIVAIRRAFVTSSLWA
jgi:hypothetical protein